MNFGKWSLNWIGQQTNGHILEPLWESTVFGGIEKGSTIMLRPQSTCHVWPSLQQFVRAAISHTIVSLVSRTFLPAFSIRLNETKEEKKRTQRMQRKGIVRYAIMFVEQCCNSTKRQRHAIYHMEIYLQLYTFAKYFHTHTKIERKIKTENFAMSRIVIPTNSTYINWQMSRFRLRPWTCPRLGKFRSES